MFELHHQPLRPPLLQQLHDRLQAEQAAAGLPLERTDVRRVLAACCPE